MEKLSKYLAEHNRMGVLNSLSVAIKYEYCESLVLDKVLENCKETKPDPPPPVGKCFA